MTTICFDLFHTLVNVPRAGILHENEILGLPQEDWERIVMCSSATWRRAVGEVTEPMQIIRDIVALSGRELSEAQMEEMLLRRVARFGAAVTQVEPEVLDTLRELRRRGHPLCLVSNADVIDVLRWDDSPLAPLFGHAIFSWQARLLKPDPAIYLLAAQKMSAAPEDCVFVGDGGSDELAGAKRVGMRTVRMCHFMRREVDGADQVAVRFRDLLGMI